MTKMLRRAQWLQTVTLVALMPGLILLPDAARSNPRGGTVVHGGVVIDDLTPGHLKIQQSTNKAIINWQDFSIAAGERTQFIQPGKDAIALNRVMSGNPSSIMGKLDANGGVILINQNGILVGSGGTVDVGGLLVMSTLDISDSDFLDGGSMTFKGSSAAAITNLGKITSRGGDVVLLANMVENSGTVGAPDGTVAFGAGGEFIVDTVGDSRISVIGAGPGGQTGIKNSGTVNAAAVEFKAHGNVYAMAIQNTGIVRANGASRQNGRIILSAAGDGSVGGKIENSGTLRARNRNGSGGEILLDGGVGGQVDIIGGSVDADGDGGRNGGTVTVLGDIVNVTGDARVSANGANGGRVQLGSPETTKSITVGPNASVSANGTTGNGGVVQLQGTPSSIINVQGAVTANGAQSGGTVLMQGGTVTTGVGSTVSANGGVAGGQVNFQGSGVNINGNVSATGAAGAGGAVRINGSQVTTGVGSAIDASGSTIGGTATIDGASGVNVNGAINANGISGGGGGVQIQGNGGGVNVGDEAAIRTDGATSGGSIQFDSAANTTVNGAVSATGLAGLGGRIDTTGDRVVIGASSDLNASGRNGGGQVNIGGSYQGADPALRNSSSTVFEDGARVKVDAWEGGNGGNAVVWSNGSTFYRGDISAQAFGAVGNGGFVEVSGREALSVEGTVSTLAANGRNGVFLIDPVNVSVGPGGGTIADSALVALLGLNNVVIHTGGAGLDAGNIRVEAGANVIYSSVNSLTFLAHNNIIVNGDIKNHGINPLTGDPLAANTGNITLVGGWGGVLPPGVGPGSPATDPVSAADFILPDGTPIVGRYGSWGATGSRVILNDANLEPVEIGSARGETNLFGDTILIKAGDGTGEFTQVGYRRTADLRDTSFFGALALPAAPAVPDPVAVANARVFAAKQEVTGNINVSGKSVVALLPDQGSNAADGIKNVTRAYTMIGHGGIRSNDGSLANRAGTDFGSDSGILSVGEGDNSGNITVRAGSVVFMQGDRDVTFTRIGHGGYGEAAVASNVNFLSFDQTDPSRALGSGVQLNSQHIIGNMSGDIRVSAAAVTIEAGLYNAAFAQIGHGGIRIRGEHSGNVSIDARSGNITGTAAPNLGAAGSPTNFADPQWNNARGNSFVQVGHGGLDSDHRLALPARTVDILLPTGVISTGVTSNPGDGITNNPLTGLPYGHSGNVTLTAQGGIQFTATGDDAYAQVGHGGQSTSGDHRGNITLEARNGSVVFDRIAIQVDQRGVDRRNIGNRAHVMVGHGGRASAGGSAGDISITASGSIEFYGGREESFAQVGHGGFNNTVANTTVGGQGSLKGPEQAQGTHTGDIRLDAGGDIIFRSGFGVGDFSYSMVGHGGYRNYADILENAGTGTLVGGGAALVKNPAFNPALPESPANRQFILEIDAKHQGHHGDITLVSGGDISFVAGQVDGEVLRGQELGIEKSIEKNIQESFTFVGHGGYESYGDHWGNISIDTATRSGGDVLLEARGGWNGVSIVGTLAQHIIDTNAPRFAVDEDGQHNGFLNFAQIGHGGIDSEHRLISSLIPAPTEGNPNPVPLQIAGDAATDIIYSTVPHGLEPGNQVAIQGLAGGTGLLNNTVYFAILVSPTSFRLATSAANAALGSAINFSANIQRQTGVSTGKLGEGMGVFGPSDITINAEGDVIVRGAQVASVGPKVQSLATLQPFAVNSTTPAVYLDPLGIPVLLSPRVSAFDSIQDIFRRNNGDIWDMPEPVMAAQDSYVQIGHGGRNTDYTAGGVTSSAPNRGDGAGHRGNISIIAGGGVLLEATDIDLAVSTNQAVRIGVYNDPDGAPGGAPPIVDGTPDRFILVGPGTPTDSIPFQPGQAAPLSSRNYAMIGNGGHTARGDHSGNITISAGKTSLDVGLSVRAGEDAQSFAQVGNGGYDADGYDPTGRVNDDNSRDDDTGSRGTVSVSVVGDILVRGGGINKHVVGANGTTTVNASGNGDPAIINNDNSSFSYAQIGHGGYITGGSHSGNITVRSTEGGVTILGGKSARFSYAMVGNGGATARGEAHIGDISVVAQDDVVVQAGGPIRDAFDLGGGDHGYPEFQNTGHLSNGSFNFAQIGNGGWDSDPQGTNLNLQPGISSHNGDIEVISVGGSVRVHGGGDPSIATNDDDNSRAIGKGNYAQIGNGGTFTDGDNFGEIRVSAGEDVVIFGGAGSRDSYAMIGHGGLSTGVTATEGGTYSGTIEVIAGRDLVMNRGADTDVTTGGTGLWAIRQNNATTRYVSTLENTTAFSIFPIPPAGTAQPAIPAGTVINTGPATGFQVGDKVQFTALIGGTGLAINTTYFIQSTPTANSFTLSGTLLGPALPFATNITAAAMQRILDVTVTDATDRITALGHTFQLGDRIRLQTAVGGLAANTTYFVRDVVGDTFRVSAANGGVVFNIAADGGSTLVRNAAAVGGATLGDGALQAFSSARDGNELFSNFAKIGHGDHVRAGQRASGSVEGQRIGDILVSAGDDVILSNPDPALRPFAAAAAYTRPNRDAVLIGHIDPITSGAAPSRAQIGNTFIAASRKNPFSGPGTGELRIFRDAYLTSAFGGLFSELRLYVPEPSLNDIESGVSINGTDYTRIPDPDGTRIDEKIGTDNTLSVGVYTEPDYAFGPEGDYAAPTIFGFYNIFYGESPDPPDPPDPPGPGGGGVGGPFLPPVEVPILPPIVVNPFNFLPFIGVDKFDSFDRNDGSGTFFYDLFSIFGLTSNWLFRSGDDYAVSVEGDEILDEGMGLFGFGPAQDESEEEEQEDKSVAFLKRRLMHGTFWTYEIGTSEYSSYKVFGIPSSEVNR